MIDFLLVGTFKAGSTSIAYGMAESRDVFIPAVKDPYYFLKNRLEVFTDPPDFVAFQRKYAVTSADVFKSLFQQNAKKFQGEATPLYLYLHEYAIPDIKSVNADAKIIIVLRNPVDRAFSNYSHNKKDGFENRSFEYVTRNYKVLENQTTHPFFHYVSSGFYAKQVKAFLDNFKDVLVVRYEDFNLAPDIEINRILHFLGATEVIPTPSLRLNKTGKVRSETVHSFIHQEGQLKSFLRPVYRSIVRSPKLRLLLSEYVKNKNIETAVLDAESRLWLQQLYLDDMCQLSDLLSFDFREFWFK